MTELLLEDAARVGRARRTLTESDHMTDPNQLLHPFDSEGQ
jgi:hypothetical protein